MQQVERCEHLAPSTDCRCSQHFRWWGDFFFLSHFLIQNSNRCELRCCLSVCLWPRGLDGVTSSRDKVAVPEYRHVHGLARAQHTRTHNNLARTRNIRPHTACAFPSAGQCRLSRVQQRALNEYAATLPVSYYIPGDRVREYSGCQLPRARARECTDTQMWRGRPIRPRPPHSKKKKKKRKLHAHARPRGRGDCLLTSPWQLQWPLSSALLPYGRW